MNKKVILLAVALPIFGITTFASADTSTCASIDKSAIKVILDKQKAGTTLTSEETSLLESAKACMPKGGNKNGSWSVDKWPKDGSGGLDRGGEYGTWGTMPEMTEAQKAQFEAVKVIMEKKKNGETLSSDEEATLAAWEANKPQWTKDDNKTNSWTTDKPTKKSSTWLNQTYKNAIDKQMKNISEKFSSYSDSDKLTKLGAYKDKVSAATTKVEAMTSLSTTKKQTYLNVLNYMLEQIQAQIDSLNGTSSDDETNDLLNVLSN